MQLDNNQAKAVANTDTQRAKIQRMVEALAKEQARLMLAEKEQQRKQARAAALARKRERAADAHRKIELGGLVIAAGLETWDPAEIVGACLAVFEQVAQHPDRRAMLRRKGLDHLEARAATRQQGQGGRR